jgi:hypothetical protein
MSASQWRAVAAVIAGIAVGALLVYLKPRASSSAKPPEARSLTTPSSPIRFTDVTSESGISFVHENGWTGTFRYPETMGAGVAVFDYDGDGDLDVYFVNGNHLTAPPDPAITGRLYRNDGGLKFTDVTQAAGVGVAGYGQGACAGDLNGDGALDLYLTLLEDSCYLQNRGDGTFVVRTKEAGLVERGWGQSCALFDYDGDSHIDLYSLKYLTYALDMPQEEHVVREGRKVRDFIGPWAFAGQSSRLYRNRGNGTFQDVTRAAGVWNAEGKGMGVSAVDFDGDDRTDIYQANDGVPDFLFRNLGHGRFEETGLATGVAVGEDGTPKSSMGGDAFDFDNDGDLDLTIPVVQRYALFRNDGGLFTEISETSGVAPATGRLTGFSAATGDFDCDGDLDVYYTNGGVHSHELAPVSADYPTRYGMADTVLANDGHGRFTDVSKSAGAYFERTLVGRGSGLGDLDNDGDLDLVVSNAGGPAVVLRNDSARGHWLTLKLRGRAPNTEALGAKIWLVAGGRKQYREVTASGGYLSSNDRRVHFGLGPAAVVDSIEIRWPDGARETRTAVPADQFLTIERGSLAKRPTP